jgi:hypothetical protein
MREHIAENCEDYGWESDSLSLEFENWLDKICKEETEDNLRCYATAVPDDVTLDNVDLDCFEKYLVKSYEEQTGWLYELYVGLPETVEDDEEVIVLKYDDELHWSDMQLGVTTPKCI